jgi:hypothetical protein
MMSWIAKKPVTRGGTKKLKKVKPKRAKKARGGGRR